MARYSLDVFQNFAAAVGGECGFTRTGFVALVAAADFDGLQANIALQRSVGIETGLLTPVELEALVPGLITTDLVAAAYEPDSGYADPWLTVTAYAQAAREAGVSISQNTAVTGIRYQAGHVVGVETTAGPLAAPIVINCAGAWGAQVAQLGGVDVPINSCRVQVAFFRRPPGHEAAHPVVGDFINATYFRSETGALTLVGLIDPSEAKAVVDPDAFPEGCDDAFVLEVGERLVTRYPAMEMSQSTGGYASLYAITPDWHPILDEIPAGSGFYTCSGFSGHGFKLAPAISLMMADLITGVSDPQFDPGLFRGSRFAENVPVRGQYEYSIIG